MVASQEGDWKLGSGIQILRFGYQDARIGGGVEANDRSRASDHNFPIIPGIRDCLLAWVATDQICRTAAVLFIKACEGDSWLAAYISWYRPRLNWPDGAA